jgi:hypothetical protein
VISVSPAAAAPARPARSRPASQDSGRAGSGSGTSIGVRPAAATSRWKAATVCGSTGRGIPAESASRCVWRSAKPGTAAAVRPAPGRMS